MHLTDRELMQQALNYMESIGQMDMHPEEWQIAVALRERLAQPNEFNPDWDAMAVMVEEQQRMAKRIEELEALETVYETIIQWDEGGGKRSRRELARRIVALYTTPPQRTWVGLTEEEVKTMWGSYFSRGLEFARAIESKLKEKK